MEPVRHEEEGEGTPEVDGRLLGVIIREVVSRYGRIKPFLDVAVIFSGESFSIIFEMIKDKEVTFVVSRHGGSGGGADGEHLEVGSDDLFGVV